jgi:hypothetical protein
MAAANVRREGTGNPFTKNTASYRFFLAGLRPLVLRVASCDAVMP